MYTDSAFSLCKFAPDWYGYYSGGYDCMMLKPDEFADMVRAVMSPELADDEKRNILYNNAVNLMEGAMTFGIRNPSQE